MKILSCGAGMTRCGRQSNDTRNWIYQHASRHPNERNGDNMAIANVENMPAVNYHGIIVYHIYKDDLIDQPPREFVFSLNPYGVEGSDEAFDIRDLVGFDPKKTPVANLVQMIDTGLFGETNLLEPEATHSDDTYSAEKTQVGKCPVCGAELTEYGSFEVHDTQIEYPFTCNNCGVSGSEWGEIVFDGFTVS